MGVLNSEIDRIRKELSDLPESISDAAHDVLVERWRQVGEECWTPEHDDEHELGEMARAAAGYAIQSTLNYHAPMMPADWPWDRKWWKPTSPRRDLVKAAALIIAEIERLDRALGDEK